MATDGPLKLRARDREDLRVVASCLQDALVPLDEVAYVPRERRFVLVANRFRWERGALDAEPAPTAADVAEGDARFEDHGEDDGPLYERVNCGVCFDRVVNVRFRGIDLGDRHQILNLLTIEAAPGVVTLVFSGGGAIRLEVGAIACHLEDLGEPWPTHWQPHHVLDDAGGDG